jgi:predicted dehydrogenase
MVGKTKKAMYKSQHINWGILGTARIARKRMIKAIQQSKGNICLAIASRDINRAKEIAEAFDIPKYYGSYEELLNDSEIDAVYIPLPNSLHHMWVSRAAEKGKHILCEKPLACTLSQVQEMIDVCKRKSVVLLEAFSYCLHPQHIKLNELIKSEIIGKIKTIEVHFSFRALKEHAIRFQSELGGGTLLDIGCYGIDITHQIYDEEPQDIDTIVKMKNEVDLEFLGILKFSDGKEALIRTSFLQDRRQTLLLSGEKGCIFLPTAFVPTNGKIYLLIQKEADGLVEEVENSDQYSLLVQEFRKNVLLNQGMDVFYRRYLRNVRTIGRLLKVIKEREGLYGTRIS